MGFRQGTDRNSGGEGEATLRVQGSPQGTEDMVTLGRKGLFSRDIIPEMLGDPQKHARYPQGRWKANSTTRDLGGAAHGSGVSTGLGS